MAPTLRRFALALAVGVVAGIGFFTTTAVANHQFSDVPTSSPFHGDIDWLTTHGVASGFPNGTFRPEDPVLRKQAARWFHNYNAQFQIVHHAGTMTSSTFTQNTVTCPAGKRPLSGGGNTSSANLFVTDIIIGATTLTVRWETDNNAVDDASTDAWALCGPVL